jgi:hypothetical protein
MEKQLSNKFAVRGSRFAVRSSWFAVRGSQFAVRSSQFAVRGSRLAGGRMPDRPTVLSSYGPILFLLMLLLLVSPAKAQKLDSLLHIHDTTSIAYFTNNLDSLTLKNYHTVPGTRITGFQRYNPLYRGDNFYASFSNTGLAHEKMFFRPELSTGFYTGMTSFDVYTFRDFNTRYYRTLIPVTYLGYDNGPEKEQLFRVIHNQNIKDIVTIGVDFYLINSPGNYDNQKSDDKSVTFTGQYYTKDMRFGMLANYRANKFIARENGGIENDTIFEQGNESDTRLINVNLTTAQNLIREQGVKANAYFFLSKDKMEKDSSGLYPGGREKPPLFHAGRISYDFNYTWQSQIYSDQDPLDEFYQNWRPVLDSNESYDSLNIKTYGNKFSWSNLRMSENPDRKPFMIMFFIKNQNSLVRDSISSRSFSTWTPGASVIIRPYRTLAIRGDGTYSFGDYNNTGFMLKGSANQQIKFKNSDTATVSFTFLTTLQEAGYFLNSFKSNYFRWDTSFAMQKFVQAYLQFNYKEHKAKLEYDLISDYVYLNQEARPAQFSGTIHLITASVQEEVRWKKWGIDVNLLYQYVSDKSVMRLPDFTASLSIFPTLPLFKNACVLQPGIDMFYNTAYYANAYMPASRMFYLQDEKKIGNYVYIDAFINLMVKRFRIYIKYQHLNSLWTQPRYYMVPHYPMQEAAFKFGMSWSFYD